MANISFMLKSFPGGGTERVIMNLAQPLTDMGHRVFLFVHELYENKLPEEELPITYIKLPYRVRNWCNYAVILNAVKRYNIEVFFAPIVYPNYLRELRNTGLCKVVYILHGAPFYEKVQKYGKMTRPYKFSVMKWLQSRVIRRAKYNSGYYDWRILSSYRKRYENTDAFGVLFDDYGRELAAALGIEYEKSHICTLQNPIRIEEHNEAEYHRAKQIVYVGRLTYWDKRLDRLLAVWERVAPKFPDWRLTFVGDGDDEKSLREIVAQKGLERVEFVGFHPEPSKFYRQAEIVCMTSMVEGCPMVLLEAQMHGCVAIAYECSAGIAEILAPVWENGVYVKNGDIDGYVDALSRLMSDDDLRVKIRNNALQSVKRFSEEVSAKQYDDLIRRLIK